MGSGASSQAHAKSAAYVARPGEAASASASASAISKSKSPTAAGSGSGSGKSFSEAFCEECQRVQRGVDERLEAALKETLEERQKKGEIVSEAEKAALRQTLAEEDEKSHPAWNAQEALSEVLAKVLSDALVKGFLPDGGCPENMDIAFVRALARESPASILEKLQGQRTLERLAEQIHSEAMEISKEIAATGAELNDKYMVAADKGFTMNFGSMVDFSKGLEQRIGSPNPNLLPSMIREHCASCDSHREWTTRNYGITTTSWKEFLLVILEVVQQCSGSPSDDFPLEWKEAAVFLSASQAPLPPRSDWPTEWPKETKNADHGGRQPATQQFLKELLELNKELAKSGGTELMLEEGIMVRLYTGPLFEKYNMVPRGGSLDGCDNKFMEQQFRNLCCEEQKKENGSKEWIENRYPTSIHVLASGVVKLSALSKAATVYRGLGGNLLPKPFWFPDKFLCKGGVEFGFMSTTRDRSVATQYAGDGSVRMVLEIETGIVDRGADLRTLSQYPQEAELLFPPLTCLQVLQTKSVRGVLVVKTRANVNLKGGTIDEVISKRYQVLKTMAEANTLEADQLLRSSTWPRILAGWEQDSSWVNDQLLNDFRKVLRAKMMSIMSAKATAYNEDSIFLAAVRDLVQLHANCKLQSSGLLRDVASEAKHARLLALAEERESMEMRRQSKAFSFEAGVHGSGSLYLFDILGFEKALDGLYYPSPERTEYRDGDVLEMRPVATKDVKLPPGWSLLSLNGCRDLHLQARTLQKQWRQGATMKMELELCKPTSRQDFSLALQNALWQGQDVGHLTNLLLSNHNREELDLHDVGLQDEQGARLVKAIHLVGNYLGELELLILGDNHIRSKTTSGLAEALKTGALPKLRQLRCYGSPMGEDMVSMMELLAALGGHSVNLEVLGLEETMLRDLSDAETMIVPEPYERLAGSFEKLFQRLESLDLSGNGGLGLQTSLAIATGLQAATSTAAAAAATAAAAGSPSAATKAHRQPEDCIPLKTLGLGGCPKLFTGIGHDAIRNFLVALQQCPALEELRLDLTGLGTCPGIEEAIFETLPKCSAKLRELWLDDNNFDPRQIRRIRAAVQLRERCGQGLEVFQI